MSGINKIIITGNLVRDPVLRHTPSNVAVCDLRIANETRTHDGDDVCFIDVTTWDKDAKSCAKKLKKGDWVAIQGRLKFDEWRAKSGGAPQSKHSISADKVVFLNFHKGNDNGSDTSSDI